MKFISLDKMKKLREAAKKGDEMAKKILHAQAYGEDFDADLDAFFKPIDEPAPEAEAEAVVEPEVKAEATTKTIKMKPPVDKETFLANSGVVEGTDEYADAVAEFEELYGQYDEEECPCEEQAQAPMADAAQEIDLTREIAQGIIDLITKCDQTSLQIMQNDDIDDTAKKGAMTSIQEIKNNLLESAEKVKKIKNSFCKKEEKELQ